MLNYKLSDNAKFNAIWSLLNVNYNEESGWLVEYDICEIYDNYAVVRNYSEGIFERVYYTKDDATDSVELGEHTRCYILDVSEAEKTALDALHGQEVTPGQRVRARSSEVFFVDPLVSRHQFPARGGFGAPFSFGALDAGNIEEFSVGILLNLLKELLGQMLCCVFVSHGCSFFLPCGNSKAAATP